MAIADLKLPWDSSPASLTREPDASILEGLRALAFGDAEVASRAESLFMFLRKITGKILQKNTLLEFNILRSRAIRPGPVYWRPLSMSPRPATVSCPVWNGSVPPAV